MTNDKDYLVAYLQGRIERMAVELDAARIREWESAAKSALVHRADATIASLRAEIAWLHGTELMACAYCGTCEPVRKDQRLPCPRGCVDPTPEKATAALQPVDAVIRNRVALVEAYRAACEALGLIDILNDGRSITLRAKAVEWNRFYRSMTTPSYGPDLGRQDPESESPALVEEPDGR